MRATQPRDHEIRRCSEARGAETPSYNNTESCKAEIELKRRSDITSSMQRGEPLMESTQGYSVLSEDR